MAKGEADFKNSELEVTITRQRTDGVAAANSNFEYTLIKKLVPAGLWGETAAPTVNGKKFLEDVATGIEIKGKDPKTSQTDMVHLDEFKFADERYENAFKWEAASSFGYEKDPQPGKKIANTVGSNEKRDALRKELGMTFSINIGKDVAGDFVTVPQIGTFVCQPK